MFSDQYSIEVKESMEPRAAPSDVEAEMPRGDLEAAMTGDARDAKDARDVLEAREAREAKEARDVLEAREAKKARDVLDAQIQIGIQRAIERFLHDNGTGTLAAGAAVPAREPPAQPVVVPYLAFMPSFMPSVPRRHRQ